jgi:hypothetical protein
MDTDHIRGTMPLNVETVIVLRVVVVVTMMTIIIQVKDVIRGACGMTATIDLMIGIGALLRDVVINNYMSGNKLGVCMSGNKQDVCRDSIQNCFIIYSYYVQCRYWKMIWRRSYIEHFARTAGLPASARVDLRHILSMLITF